MTRPHPLPSCPACQPSPGPLLSVWPAAQRDSRTQRRGRYLPASTAHPAKMLPAIAAHAISHYTQPGDLVLDPMCGIGTTAVEAIHLGRDAIGVEFEDRWAKLAAANITHARQQGATGSAEVFRGDARQLPAVLPGRLAGQAALVITSPPYGASVHGQVRAEQRRGHGGGVRKYDNHYSHDPANLAHHGLDDLLDGFTRILAGCRAVLRPGGIVAITARPWRQQGELTDLPAAVIAAGTRAGLIPAARHVALLAGLRDDCLIPRPSFFQLDNTRKARRRGEPWSLIVHEDVLIFQAPQLRPSSGQLKPVQLEPECAPPAIPGPGTWAEREPGRRAA
jgi:modification methylase